MSVSYSIYTVLNSDYMTFGKIFINSLYDKVDVNNIKHIYILDIGLVEEDKKYLNGFDKVKILPTDFNLDFTGIHSENWVRAVVAKTYFIRKLLIEQESGPVVMIDSDCMFIDDISGLVDTDYDMQICYRGEHSRGQLLGSYVSFNDKEKSIQFLNEWIDEIPHIETPWKETPALNNTYPSFIDKIKFGLVPIHKVSSYEFSDMGKEDVSIIHFKTGARHSTVEETIQKRIEERGFKDYCERYLDV